MHKVKFYSMQKQRGYFRPSWIVARLREPSTYQGLALLGGLFGHVVNVDLMFEIGVGIAGAISVLLPQDK